MATYTLSEIKNNKSITDSWNTRLMKAWKVLQKENTKKHINEFILFCDTLGLDNPKEPLIEIDTDDNIITILYSYATKNNMAKSTLEVSGDAFGKYDTFYFFGTKEDYRLIDAYSLDLFKKKLIKWLNE